MIAPFHMVQMRFKPEELEALDTKAKAANLDRTKLVKAAVAAYGKGLGRPSHRWDSVTETIVPNDTAHIAAKRDLPESFKLPKALRTDKATAQIADKAIASGDKLAAEFHAAGSVQFGSPDAPAARSETPQPDHPKRRSPRLAASDAGGVSGPLVDKPDVDATQRMTVCPTLSERTGGAYFDATDIARAHVQLGPSTYKPGERLKKGKGK